MSILVQMHLYAMLSAMVNVTDDAEDIAITAWARLIRVSQQALAHVEERLKKAGLPPLAWYDALLELRRAGDQGLRPFQLREKMLLEQYNLSRLIDRLADKNLVVKQTCEEDGRGQVLVITLEGRQTLKTMWPVYRRAIMDQFAANLSDSDCRTLTRLLGKLK